jgi:hypothetical protein
MFFQSDRHRNATYQSTGSYRIKQALLEPAADSNTIDKNRINTTAET